MNNPYKTLGLSRTANLDIARSKYIQLSKKFHPDISKYSPQISEKKMKQINSAYSLIKTSITRGIISYRPKGRFTKEEIDELILRFKEGQSLYKIGRGMKRKQKSIKMHLIKAGLLEDKFTYDIYKDREYVTKSWFYDKFVLIALISVVMIVEPIFNILELWLNGIFIILNKLI